MKPSSRTRVFMSGIIGLALICAGAFPSPVYAQNSIVDYVGNIGPVAIAAISCNKDRIKKGIKSLFGNKDEETPDLSSVNAVPTSIASDSVQAKITASATQETQKKLNCTNVIGRAAAQVLLNRITTQTVAWINRGFQGAPLYVRDTASFLKDIRQTAIGDFRGTLLSNSKDYPYGRLVMASLQNQISNYFEDNAKYSLDAVVSRRFDGKGAIHFEKDFAIGGWDAFLAGASSNNNPFGFQIAAQEELAFRLKGTTYPLAQELKDEVDRGLGFLDLKECVALANGGDGSTYDFAKSPKKVKDANKRIQELQAQLNTTSSGVLGAAGNQFSDQISAQIKDQQRIISENTCVQWQTNTPGSVIAESAYKTFGSPLDSLALGDDITKSMAAIIDALLNQLVTKGLSSIDSGNKIGTEGGGTYGTNNITVSGSSADWNNVSVGNIFTDIPKLIDIENRLIPELEKEIVVVQAIIPAIYRLDFCVPGPHPGWEAEAQDTLGDIISGWPRDADEIATGAAKFGLSLNISKTAKIIQKLTGSDRNKRLYNMLLEITTGLKIDPANDGVLKDYDTAVRFVETIFERYIEAIDRTYFSYEERSYPDQRYTAEKDFRNIPRYQTATTENQDTISAIEALIGQLNRVQTRINELPNKDGYPEELRSLNQNSVGEFYQQELENIQGIKNLELNEYQIELRRISDIFNLIAPDLHSEKDITEEEAAFEDVNNRLGELTGEVISRVYKQGSNIVAEYQKLNLVGEIAKCVAETSTEKYKSEHHTDRMPYPAWIDMGDTTDIKPLLDDLYLKMLKTQFVDVDGFVSPLGGVTSLWTGKLKDAGYLINGPTFLSGFYYGGGPYDPGNAEVKQWTVEPGKSKAEYGEGYFKGYWRQPAIEIGTGDLFIEGGLIQQPTNPISTFELLLKVY